MVVSPDASPNQTAADLWEALFDKGARRTGNHRVLRQKIADATVFDFGVQTPGSIDAGLTMAAACMGGLAQIEIAACDPQHYAVANAVRVQTDAPLLACLGCQYAGWPVQCKDYFAMGSGPMRLRRGKESVLKENELTDEQADVVCGLLESDSLPTAAAIAEIASECGVPNDRLLLGVAPSTSIAGSIQVVARSVETAMHKLHDLEFDLAAVVSATGFAPLPPPAAKGKTIDGIGRTNDAMLYGATVTFWVDCDDSEIDSILDRIPSASSGDHGRPFRKIFADYDNDFYKVDPSLFSPAVVLLHNLRTGQTHQSGRIETAVLRESFGR